MPTDEARIGQSGQVSTTLSGDDGECPDEGVDVPRLFGVERDRLFALLASVSPGDWQLPTPCPGWDVLGLCTHLVGDDLDWLARHRDGHHDTTGPNLDESGFAVWLDDRQLEWVRAARRLSPRLVMDLLHWSCPQIVEALANQDVLAVTASVSWASPGLVPVWLDQLRELTEQWIHRQQLLQALGKPSDLRSDLAGPVLDGLRWAYPYRLAAVAAGPGDTVTIRVTGDLGREWNLVFGDQGWRFSPTPGVRMLATLTMSGEQAWRLLTNNLPSR